MGYSIRDFLNADEMDQYIGYCEEIGEIEKKKDELVYKCRARHLLKTAMLYKSYVTSREGCMTKNRGTVIIPDGEEENYMHLYYALKTYILEKDFDKLSELVKLLRTPDMVYGNEERKRVEQTFVPDAFDDIPSGIFQQLRTMLNTMKEDIREMKAIDMKR